MNQKAEIILSTMLRPDQILSDPEAKMKYGQDWTRVYTPLPSCIVFPETTHEVASVVKAANETPFSLVPSGGRTGLSAGAVAIQNEVVLSLERMNRLSPVDTLGHSIVVEAGVITEALHNHLLPHGLTWPVDFASKGSSHVGGNIATNAGGIRVIRYGLTRNWVLGLEVVLPTGDIVSSMHALEKNNTGLDLKHLFIGTEGTLGIITRAVLKLCPLPPLSQLALCTLGSLDHVANFFTQTKQQPFTVTAFEWFTSACMKRLLPHRNLTFPFAQVAPHQVLLEVDAHPSFEAFLADACDAGILLDAKLAQNEEQKTHLWTFREGISESLSATGMPHKNDIALPVANLTSFIAAFETLTSQFYRQDHGTGIELCLFGHFGDGNLHVNIMKPESMSKQQFLDITGRLDPHMYGLVQKHQGSVSAEHGIGLLKRHALHFTRTETEINLMKQIKQVLDPNHILNPGKIF